MTNKIELLAPAGNMRCAIAAIQAGANAVYLSGKAFGARAFADNFEIGELEEITKYAHIHLVKVYVTINTIIFNNEFDQLEEYLKELIRINVDAVIVQDLGVIKFIKTKYPELRVHASTQINVYSFNALEVLSQMGVERCILAREVSLKDATKLAKFGMQLEVFAHGAMCFSNSGNCYFSYAIGGRSGNRGECAQICRKKFALIEDGIDKSKPLNTLSMKDLMTLDYISEIINSGVASIKIEGRMKSPEYVYTVISCYRNAIDKAYEGKKYNISDEDFDKIKVAFNRTFTKGYLMDDDNVNLVTRNFVNHQGIPCGKVISKNNNFVDILLSKPLSMNDGLRIKSEKEIGLKVTKIEVNKQLQKSGNIGNVVRFYIKNNCKPGDIVVKTLSKALETFVDTELLVENIKSTVNVEIDLFVGKKMLLHATTAYGEDIYVSGDELEYSETMIDKTRIISQLGKLTSTTYQLGSIKINTDNQVFIKISELNQIRNKMVEGLNDLRVKSFNKSNTVYHLNKDQTELSNDEFDFYCATEEQANTIKSLGFNNVYDKSSLRRGDNNTEFIHSINQYTLNSKVLNIYQNITNNYGISVCKDLGLDTVYLSKEVVLSDLNKFKFEKGINCGYLVYGAIDLMCSNHCVVGALNGAKNKKCGNCVLHKYAVKDELGEVYPLVLENNNCIMRVTDSKKCNYIDKISYFKQLGLKKFLFIFTNESIDDVQKVIELIK